MMPNWDLHLFLMFVGFALIGVATLYITVATFSGFYNRHADAVFTGTGMVGCLLIIGGLIIPLP